MKNIRYIFTLLFSLIVLFSLSGCTGKTEADTLVIERGELLSQVSAPIKDRSLYVSGDKKSYELVAKSDMIELYFNKKSCCVGIYEIASGTFWTALPRDDRGEGADVIRLTVLIDGNEYILSSQSDSVGYGSALYEKTDKGITVSYSFKRSLEGNRKINLNIPVSFLLTDGGLTVSADLSQAYSEGHDKDIILTRLELLPFFGACQRGEKGDYMLISDGCGATVDISENPKKFKAVSLPVYDKGNIIGAFGMKKGNGAFTGLAQEGDGLSQIHCEKALSGGGLNRVWASFTLTETSFTKDKTYAAALTYEGTVQVSYRFLSYNNAGYTGMAGAVRELLIRQGRLPSKSLEEGEYPFNMSLVFGNFVTDSRGRTLSQTLTDSSQALELISSLKAKGIESINIRLKGILDKDNITSPRLYTKAIDEEAIDDILATGSNMRVYADIALLTSYPDSAFDSLSLNVTGEAREHEGRCVASSDIIEDNTLSAIRFLRESDITGVCLSDAGELLFSDYTSGKIRLRADTAQLISRGAASLSASAGLMVDTGNIYTVKYADTVVGIPLTAGVEGRELCSAVPFVQSVLHGITDYSGSPINLYKNREKAFLKAIEYGCVPYYEWYAADLSTQEQQDKGSYLNYISQAQSQYERACEAFSDLRGARITDHYKVEKSLYYTEYDGSRGIYVNYGDAAVTVNGVTVESMSFVRVS